MLLQWALTYFREGVCAQEFTKGLRDFVSISVPLTYIRVEVCARYITDGVQNVSGIWEDRTREATVCPVPRYLALSGGRVDTCNWLACPFAGPLAL